MKNKIHITADTLNRICELVQKDTRYEEVLKKYFTKKQDRDEFRQHLWLQICQTDREKVIKAWNERWFIYFYTSLCNNQIKSYSSSWYKNNNNKIFCYTPDYVLENNNEHEELYSDSYEFDKIEAKRIINEAIEYYKEKDKDFIYSAQFFLHKLEGKSAKQIEKLGYYDIKQQSIAAHIRYVKTLLSKYVQKKKINIYK